MRRSPHSGARARPPFWFAAAACGVLLTSIAIGWWSRRQPGSTPSETLPVTLAVMPFRSIPPGSDVLELGLADVFINRLSRLSEIRVLPLTATERLRAGDDPGEAARRLGATHMLYGRLHREHGFVRATVQLVSTSDNRTIWSSPVDTDASTLFAIQDIVVTRVLEELAPQLTAGARRALAQPGTRNNNAYEAYVRGRAHAAKPARAELTRAVELLERAVELDPAYADAWAALGTASRMLPLFDGVPTRHLSKRSGPRRGRWRSMPATGKRIRCLAPLPSGTTGITGKRRGCSAAGWSSSPALPMDTSRWRNYSRYGSSRRSARGDSPRPDARSGLATPEIPRRPVSVHGKKLWRVARASR